MTNAEYKARRKEYWRATRKARRAAAWQDLKACGWQAVEIAILLAGVFLFSGWCGGGL